MDFWAGKNRTPLVRNIEIRLSFVGSNLGSGSSEAEVNKALTSSSWILLNVVFCVGCCVELSSLAK